MNHVKGAANKKDALWRSRVKLLVDNHVKPILGIRRGERGVAAVALLFAVALNALLIYKYFGILTPGGTQGYYSIFMKRFQVSGFDASSCIALSCEDIYFNTFRHPLFFTILWPFYWLNQWLMSITGINCAIFIMATLQVVSAVYSVIFAYRIFTDILGLARTEARSLTLLLFSFAYIMLSLMVPDHFGLSLPWLLLTVLLAGRCFKRGTAFKPCQQAVLFFFTAGLTLTNGLKSCLAFLFAAPRRVWRWRSVLSVVLPLALLFGIRQYQQVAYEQPMKERVAMMIEIKKQKDPNFGKGDAKIVAWREKQNGTAIDKDNLLLQWSDISTPRLPSVIHNLMGESLILHSQHLLEDVQNNRPVFVAYDQGVFYVVEGLVALLFIIGVCYGRRSRLMWLLLSWFAFDMLMHVGFGFGLNEVYIMTAHWAFIIPIAIGFAIRQLSGTKRELVVSAVSALGAWMFFYNLAFIVGYCVD